MNVDPLAELMSGGFTFAPIDEPPKKTRKPRAKKADLPALTPDNVVTILDSVEVIEEDTTPIVWDGVLPEPPKDWMKHHTWKVIQSIEELRAWWEAVKLDTANHVGTIEDKLLGTGKVHPKIGFDLETTGLDNRLVLGFQRTHVVGVCLSCYSSPSRAYSSGRAATDAPEVPIRVCEGLYIPVAHKRWSTNLDMKEVLAILDEILRTSIIVTYNGKFDFLSILGEGDLVAHEVPFHGYTETVYTRQSVVMPKYPFLEDAQALLFMIDCDRAMRGGTNLKAVSGTFLGQEMIEFDEITDTGQKKKRSKKKILNTFDSVAPPTGVYYAAADAICTLQLSDLFAYIREVVPLVNRIDHYTVETQAWLEQQRPLIDREYLLDEDRFLAMKCEHTLRQIQKIVGFEINPDSTKVLGQTLFEKMGLPNKGKTAPSKLYPLGNWSTDAATMDALALEHPELTIFKLIVSYRQLRSAYPKKLHDGSDALDASAKFGYSATRTPTGRFACSGGEYEKDGGAGLNVQAIQALYATKYIEVQGIDTLALQGVKGLASSSMFDPILFEWLRNQTRVVNPVEFPNRELITADVKVTHPDLDADALKAEVQGQINMQLQSHKGLGLSTLKEGVSLFILQDNPTVINNHLKLTPDAWACILHECPHCFLESDTPCQRFPLTYDTSEIMNLRRAFVAPPGWTFFSIDYAAIELRVVTNLAGEQLWIDGFVGGKDLHASMAAAIFKDKFSSADAAERSNLRSQAKTITFGNLYGGTAKTIQQHLSYPISIQEAEELYRNWIGAIPYYQRWVNHQKDFVHRYQKVYTAFGRIRPLEQEFATRDRIKISYAERTALNHPSQGSAADILRTALYRIYKWVTKNNLEDYVKIHFHVHDEIDVSCKDEWVPFVIPHLVKLLKVDDVVKNLNWPVPLDCDVEYGKSWDVKFKQAKHGWSGILGLKGLPQAGFKKLYDTIIEGATFSVEDYKTQILPVIYAYWDKTGYVDPYRDFVEKKVDLTKRMITWQEKNSGWPTMEALQQTL